MNWLLKVVAAFLGVYAIFPTLLARLCHVGVIWRTTPGRGRVALTFDDGPDPVYTPQILEVLRQYNARACFFVLGEKAHRYPELVDRLLADGHEVANHGYTHCFYWFMGPGSTKQDVERGAMIIEQMTGRRPRLFRPPWGVVNACALWWSRYLRGQRVVLWSFIESGWRVLSAEQIAGLVLRRVRDGSILTFHDSDTTFGAARGSAAKVVAALPLILAGVQKKGLSVVSIDEMVNHNSPPLLLRNLRRFWGLWEHGFQKLFHVSDPGGPDCLFRLAVHRYPGPARVLPDGTSLEKGDTVAELHIKNELIMTMTEGAPPERSAIMFMRAAQNSLPRLAAVLRNHPGFREVKALIGYTMFHRGIKRIGFSVFELPRLVRATVTVYEAWLMIVYHNGGWGHVRRQWRKLVPKLVVISKDSLLAEHPEGHEEEVRGSYRQSTNC